MISIVCVYNNEGILKEELLDSLRNQTSEYELILLDNTHREFKSAAEALNQGAVKGKGKYIMFVHQDVHLRSKSFLESAEKLLNSIPDLGIAGTAGALESERAGVAELVTDIKHGIPPMNASSLAAPLQGPMKVQTLDESLVIIPRHVFDILKFDERVCDDWHLYAVDYSLSVTRLGFGVYVIPFSIYHRSTGVAYWNMWQVIWSMGRLTAGYYDTLGKLLKKHRPYARHIYTSAGHWNTSYPLTLNRVADVLHYIRNTSLVFIVTKGIVSKPRNAFKRIYYAVRRPQHSEH